jgi:hypothetical protein
MSKFLRSVLVVGALLTGVSAAMAEYVPDQNDAFGGYDPNSQEGNKAFWDNQARKSGG